MALEAGSVYLTLKGLFERDEFDKWDRAVDSERVKARDPIDAKLGADTSPLERGLAQARAMRNSWAQGEADAKLGVDQGFLDRMLAAARSKITAFTSGAGGEVKLKVNIDDAAAQAKLAALKAEIAALGGDVPVGGIGTLSGLGLGRVLSGPAGARGPGGLMGVRGPGGGSADNPVVVTVESARFTGLGARAAEIAYPSGTEQTPTASTINALGGPSQGSAQPASGTEAPSWMNRIGMLMERQQQSLDRLIVAGRSGSASTTGPAAVLPATEDINAQLDQGTLARALAAIKAAVTGDKATVDIGVGANTAAATAEIETVRAEAGKTVDMKVDADVGAAEAKVAALKAEAAKPVSVPFDPKMGAFRDPTTGRTLSYAQAQQYSDPYSQAIHRGPVSESMPYGGGYSTRNDPFAMYPGGGGGGGGGMLPPVAMGGGDPGGGGGGGGGARSAILGYLFGSGAGLGPRQWWNPFAAGIHGPLGAVGSAAGLGPEHLLSAAAAVGGSAAGGVAGAGVTALGALGTLAVGGGSDAAVMKSTIADTQVLYKSYQNLSQAVQVYGANSKQAAVAQAQYNAQIQALGGAGAVGVKAEMQLAQNVSALNTLWDKTTQNARVQAVNILNQVVQLGKDYVPKVANAAQQNLSIINVGLKPLFAWLEGPAGMGIFDNLENKFKKDLPTAVDAFNNLIEALLKTVNDASQYTGGFIKSLDRLAQRWNNMDPSALNATIAKLHNDFELWRVLIEYVGKDLFALFRAGSGEGNSLIAMFDNLLKKWNQWENSAKGQDFLKTFFENRKNELIAVLRLVGSLVHAYGQVFVALQPLVPVVTTILKDAGTGLATILSVTITPLASALASVLKFFVDIGKQSKVLGVAVQAGLFVPLGLFLASWKVFGLESTKNFASAITNVDLLKSKAREAFGVIRTLFKEGPGAAWQGLKDLFSGKAKISGTEQMNIAADKMNTAADKMAGAAEKMSGAATEQNAAGEKQKEGGALQDAAGKKQKEAGVLQEGAGAEESTAGKLQMGAGAEEEAAATGLLSKIPFIGKFFGGGAAAAGGAAAVEGAGAATTTAAVTAGEGAAAVGTTASIAAAATAALPVILAGGGLVALTYGVSKLAQSIFGGGHPQVYNPSVSTLPGAPNARGSGPNPFAPGPGTSRFAPGPGTSPFAPGPGTSPFTPGVAQHLDQNAVDKFTRSVASLGDTSKLSAGKVQQLLSQANKFAKEPDITKEQRAGLTKLISQLRENPAAQWATQWKHGMTNAQQAVNLFYRDSGRDIKSLKDDFSTNMRLIASTVGLQSGEGRKLMGENVQKMVEALRKGMLDGTVSVAQGMKALKQALDQGMKNNATSWTTAWQDMYKTVNSLYAKHKIDTATYLKDLNQLMNQLMHTNSQNWNNNWQDMFDSLAKMYGKGKIDLQTFLKDSHNITNTGLQHIKDDTEKSYQDTFHNLEQQRHKGIISGQQFNDKVHQAQLAANTQQKVDIGHFAGNIATGMAAAGKLTSAAMTDPKTGIITQLNNALHAVGASKITMPQLAGAAIVGTIVQSIQGITSQFAHGLTLSAQGGIAIRQGGGMVPGKEFGYEDNMTLVDPLGRPRAKMAGDEGILTRHQMPVIDYALSVAHSVGAVPYGSLGDVWGGVRRPHGYEQGGVLPGYQSGGVQFSGPVSTFGPPGEAAGGTAFGRSSADPGLSLRIPGTTFGDARNRALMGHIFKTTIAGHTANLMDIDLGPAEWTGRNIDVTGAGVAALGIPYGAFPTGAIGTVTELGAGAVTTIGGAMGAIGAAPTLKSPVIHGPGAQITVANKGLQKVTDGANQYLQKKYAALAALSGGAGGAGYTGYIGSGGPAAHNAYLGVLPVSRTDQGVDFTGVGNVLAVADGSVLTTSAWPGWPGTGRGVVYSTQYGNVYAVENVTPLVSPGQRVKAGDPVVHVNAGYPWLETGWANASATGPLTPYNGSADGTAMPGGISFRKFIGFAQGGLMQKSQPRAHLTKEEIQRFSLEGRRELEAGAPHVSGHAQGGWLPGFARGGEVVGASIYGPPGRDPTVTSSHGAYNWPRNLSAGSIARLKSGSSYMWNKLAPQSLHTLNLPGQAPKYVRVEDWGQGGSEVEGHPRTVDLWWETAQHLGIPSNEWTNWTGLVRIDGHNRGGQLANFFGGGLMNFQAGGATVASDATHRHPPKLRPPSYYTGVGLPRGSTKKPKKPGTKVKQPTKGKAPKLNVSKLASLGFISPETDQLNSLNTYMSDLSNWYGYLQTIYGDPSSAVVDITTNTTDAQGNTTTTDTINWGDPGSGPPSYAGPALTAKTGLVDPSTRHVTKGIYDWARDIGAPPGGDGNIGDFRITKTGVAPHLPGNALTYSPMTFLGVDMRQLAIEQLMASDAAGGQSEYTAWTGKLATLLKVATDAAAWLQHSLDDAFPYGKLKAPKGLKDILTGSVKLGSRTIEDNPWIHDNPWKHDMDRVVPITESQAKYVEQQVAKYKNVVARIAYLNMRRGALAAERAARETQLTVKYEQARAQISRMRATDTFDASGWLREAMGKLHDQELGAVGQIPTTPPSSWLGDTSGWRLQQKEEIAAVRSEFQDRRTAVQQQAASLRFAGRLRAIDASSAVSQMETKEKGAVTVYFDKLRNQFNTDIRTLTGTKSGESKYINSVLSGINKFITTGTATEQNTTIATDYSQFTDPMGSFQIGILEMAQSTIPDLLQLRSDLLGTTLPPTTGTGTDTSGAATASDIAAAAYADLLAFQGDLATLFQTYGSNFVPYGQNPFQSQTGIDAGMAFYGAASGPGAVLTAGGAGAGGAATATTQLAAAASQLAAAARGGMLRPSLNVENHFGGGPADPHTWAAGQKYELGALLA